MEKVTHPRQFENVQDAIHELRILHIYAEHADTVSNKYYFGCIQVNFETVKKFAGDQLREKSALAQQWLNEQIIKKCN